MPDINNNQSNSDQQAASNNNQNMESVQSISSEAKLVQPSQNQGKNSFFKNPLTYLIMVAVGVLIFNTYLLIKNPPLLEKVLSFARNRNESEQVLFRPTVELVTPTAYEIKEKDISHLFTDSLINGNAAKVVYTSINPKSGDPEQLYIFVFDPTKYDLISISGDIKSVDAEKIVVEVNDLSLGTTENKTFNLTSNSIFFVVDENQVTPVELNSIIPKVKFQSIDTVDYIVNKSNGEESIVSVFLSNSPIFSNNISFLDGIIQDYNDQSKSFRLVKFEDDIVRSIDFSLKDQTKILTINETFFIN